MKKTYNNFGVIDLSKVTSISELVYDDDGYGWNDGDFQLKFNVNYDTLCKIMCKDFDHNDSKEFINYKEEYKKLVKDFNTKMEKKYNTYHTQVNNDQISNTEILTLENDIGNLNDKKGEFENKIKEIRDNCVHEFYMLSSGTYEDAYRCVLCGEITWK